MYTIYNNEDYKVEMVTVNIANLFIKKKFKQYKTPMIWKKVMP